MTTKYDEGIVKTKSHDQNSDTEFHRARCIFTKFVFLTSSLFYDMGLGKTS